MKTLDEVIKALDMCQRSNCEKCPYNDPNYDICDDKVQAEALHYLKMYRSDMQMYAENQKHWEDELMQKIKDFGDAKDRYIARLKELDIGTLNDPLSWDELKQMTGKPVWIEHLCGVLRWGIIDDLYYDRKEEKTKVRFGTRHGFLEWDKDDQGRTWQAYRKERS